MFKNTAPTKKRASMSEAKTPEQDYIERLKYHDWYYAYADDGRVYRRGAAAEEVLRALQKQLDPDYKIWNEHAPEQFKKIVQAAAPEKNKLKKEFKKKTTRQKKEPPTKAKNKPGGSRKKGLSK